MITAPVRGSFAELKKRYPNAHVIDKYEALVHDLFLVRNPKFKFAPPSVEEVHGHFKKHTGGQSAETFGNWFYLPWRETLVHYLSAEEHQELRTARNRELITKAEQDIYSRACVAIAGMSVGSHVAQVIAMTGGARHMKLADPDVISGDNLNRIRAGFPAVGMPKAESVAQALWEADPYMVIDIFSDGVTAANVGEFLSGVDILVEEMDNPYWKFRIREVARERGIPVVMGTDNGDGVIVDIERFDVRRRTPLFNGLVGKMSAQELENMPPTDLPKVAARIAGADRAPLRMLDSVAEVGRSLYSWPQLGTAANLCGTVVAYLARRIALKNKNIRSGRYQVDLDRIFETGHGRRWLNRKVGFIKFVRKMNKR
ncbi:MAG TPA: ThiF family adenylyltransferase [Candidatus Paceibacterota bacterium]|nr:ThiF family adenylyltransferase [Candidatus Paceibacterota bacterium]